MNPEIDCVLNVVGENDRSTIEISRYRTIVFKKAKDWGLPTVEAEDVAQEMAMLAFTRGYVSWNEAWAGIRAAIARWKRRCKKFVPLESVSPSESNLIDDDFAGFRQVEMASEIECAAKKCLARAEKCPVRYNLLLLGRLWLRRGEERMKKLYNIRRKRHGLRPISKSGYASLKHKIKMKLREEGIWPDKTERPDV